MVSDHFFRWRTRGSPAAHRLLRKHTVRRRREGRRRELGPTVCRAHSTFAQLSLSASLKGGFCDWPHLTGSVGSRLRRIKSLARDLLAHKHQSQAFGMFFLLPQTGSRGSLKVWHMLLRGHVDVISLSRLIRMKPGTQDEFAALPQEYTEPPLGRRTPGPPASWARTQFPRQGESLRGTKL